ncbi:MAG TPA: DMT family transporter [Paracoccaceae bacterium]|nr:DMT family transporter [Paracoccaceae bacterium]
MALSDNARGAAFMALAMAAFTGNDALMKQVTQHLPLMQAIVVRGVISGVMLAALAMATGGLRLGIGPADRGPVALRTLAEVGATLTFLTALIHLPLANISAILQALPLAVTLASALVFGDRVGWRRLSAIGVGFVGVVLIVRPGVEGFTVWSLVAVASVLCVVVRDLSTRRLTGVLPTSTVALYTAGAVTAMGAVGMAFGPGWQPVGGGALTALTGAAVLIVVGYTFIIKAMRVGEVSFVAPYRYTSLLAAILLGWLMFGSLPDALTWAGSALIVASGLFTMWRESRLKRT